MAGKGPAPKLHNQRGTSNWTRLEPLKRQVLPAIRDVLGHDKVPKLSLLLWNSWRDDPVTATWTATEIALAADTITLHIADSVGKSSEIRIRLDSLALTPKGRRDARLLLPEDEDPEVEEAPPAPARLHALPEAK
jgi:hypothetical protein